VRTVFVKAAAVVEALQTADAVAGLTPIQVMDVVVVAIGVAVIATTMMIVMIQAASLTIMIAVDAGQSHEADLDPDQEKGIAAAVIVTKKIREGVLNEIDLDHRIIAVIVTNLVSLDDHPAERGTIIKIVILALRSLLIFRSVML